jgi:hypothetical protein
MTNNFDFSLDTLLSKVDDYQDIEKRADQVLETPDQP